MHLLQRAYAAALLPQCVGSELILFCSPRPTDRSTNLSTRCVHCPCNAWLPHMLRPNHGSAMVQVTNPAAAQVALLLYCDEVRKLLLKYTGYECAVCLYLFKRLQLSGSARWFRPFG